METHKNTARSVTAFLLSCLIAFVTTWMVKENEERSLTGLRLATIFIFGYNFIMLMFGNRLFFDLIKLI